MVVKHAILQYFIELYEIFYRFVIYFISVFKV